MKLDLISEVKSFTNREGQQVIYVNYYVVVDGIVIKMKPVEMTGSQLLKNYVLKKGGKE